MAGLALIPAIASAAGSVVSGMGAANSANSQAKIKEYQAQMALRQGLEDAAVGQQNAANDQRKMVKTLSDQQAGLAASGGGLLGSAQTFEEQTASQGIFKRDTSLWEGAEKQVNDINQANLYQTEASAYRQSAKTDMASGVIGGISGVFGGLGKGFASGGGFNTSSNYFYGSNNSSPGWG